MDKPMFFENNALETIAIDEFHNHDMRSRILLALLESKGIMTHEEYLTFEKDYVNQLFKSLYPDQF